MSSLTYVRRTIRSLVGASASFLMLAFYGALPVNGQNDAVTPLAMSPGSPQGSYGLSDIDTVSLFNGRAHIRIPIFGQPGRGQTSSQVALTIDSTAPWQVTPYTDGYGNPGYGLGLSYYTSQVNISGTQYSIRFVGTGTGANFCAGGYYGDSYIFYQTLTRMYLIDPEGTEHEMRDVLTDGQPVTFTGNCSSAYGALRGKVFVATDGSGATYISDDNINDGILIGSEQPVGGGNGGWLLLKDGRRIRIVGPSFDLKDRNGNKLTSNLTDTLNRVTTSGTGTQTECGQIFGTPAPLCIYYARKGFAGTERRVWISYTESQMPEKIRLPNGLEYKIYYNDYFEVTRIDLPSGGSIEYDYEPGLGGSQPDVSSWVPGAFPGTYPDAGSGFHVYRRLTERRLYREGHVLESRQTFSKPESLNSSYQRSNEGYVEKTNYDANDHLLSSEKHYFYGGASDSFDLTALEYSAWRSGREYLSEFYDSAGTLMRWTATAWENRTSVDWWPLSSTLAPQKDPRVSQTISYLENSQSATTVYAYDSTVPWNSLTDVYNYDYGGTLLRHTQTTYLETLNNIDYAGTNIQSASDLHMRDFPLQVSILDGGGTERARTTYEYDNYSTETNHAGLVNRLNINGFNISGFDSSYSTSYTTRGNVTKTTRYLLTNGSVTGSISTYAQYEIAGNVVKTIDGNGNETTISYTDCFGAPNGNAQTSTAPSELSSVSEYSYAFATSATRSGHTVYAQFDFYLGTPVDVEDVNGIVSSSYFDDPLDRPSKVIRASNQGTGLKSQSVFAYNDTDRIITTTADKSTFEDGALKSQTLYDGLGRTVETRQYETSSTYIAVQQVPFEVVQESSVWRLTSKSSNPFRPYLSETAVWTTAYADALGRVIKVKTPDNALVLSAYSGNTVIVTDQAGKKRKSVSDALGRLTSVYEDPDSLNYATNYTYDVLDDLTGVSQYDSVSNTTQTRTFTYDSLKRLVSANNPENGTISYEYDNNSNLTLKVDPRVLPNTTTHIQTTYAYDALNRVSSRSYNDGTPTVNYFYDSQSLPSGAPSTSSPDYYSRGYSAGRLVAVTYGTSSSTGDYFGYDGVGRVVMKFQRTGSVNYKTTASYDLAGAITSETYPSGHSVSYGFDGSGRTSSFTGNLGDGTSRNYSTEIVYSQFGMAKEKFGTTTPIYTKMLYNVRGQLAEIRAGTTYTSSTDTSWNRGAIINHYGNGSSCWGASCSAADNNGNVMKQEHWIPLVDTPQPTGSGQYTVVSQEFDYDSLNRLQDVHEGTSWKQEYVYDRFGNRKIHQTNTTGVGIPKPNYGVDPATNRLTAPSGSTMTYDAAGNLTYDNSNGSQGDRVYDAENRMTAAKGGLSAAWQYYVYDGEGKRIKRNITGGETWQMYGIGVS